MLVYSNIYEDKNFVGKEETQEIIKNFSVQCTFIKSYLVLW